MRAERAHNKHTLLRRPPAHSSSRSTSCTANNPPNFSFFFSSTFNRHRARARARTLHWLHAETMAILCDRTKSISERFCPVAFNCMSCVRNSPPDLYLRAHTRSHNNKSSNRCSSSKVSSLRAYSVTSYSGKRKPFNYDVVAAQSWRVCNVET